MLLTEVASEKHYNSRAINILAEAGITTEKDLAEFIPKKYADYLKIRNIKNCVGEYAAVTGKMFKAEQRESRNKKYLYCAFRQEDGTFFNSFIFTNSHLFAPYQLLTGQHVVVFGKVSYNPDFGYSISADNITHISEFVPHIYGFYKKFKGISAENLLRMINNSLADVTDDIPPQIREKYNIPEYREALYLLHHPLNQNDITTGKNRILLSDLLSFYLSLSESQESSVSAPVIYGAQAANIFYKMLPFKMTKDQIKAIQTVLEKMKKGEQADALLQGDVGCGKTVVAAALMFAAASCGYQAVLAAPRSVLAAQHYHEINGYCSKLGLNCVFLHSGMKRKEEKDILSEIETGEAQIIVGTHSCFSEKVKYHNLAMAVIDEEHLFGVNQKKVLESKALPGFHKISMSATPIPRTLTDVLFADSRKILLNIKEKPAGRLPIQTLITDREQSFSKIKEEIQKGHKCYVVFPAIDSDEMENVEETGQIYINHFLPLGYKCQMITGKCTEKEIDKSMHAFHEGEIQILLSTTVIEVGVNDPLATIIVIEEADRFGLATLHQLRGRVGRSDIQSFCYLVSEEKENERLLALEKTNDGFEIAQMDINIRGTGDILGIEQSGYNKQIDEALRNPEMFKLAKKIGDEIRSFNHVSN